MNNDTSGLFRMLLFKLNRGTFGWSEDYFVLIFDYQSISNSFFDQMASLDLDHFKILRSLIALLFITMWSFALYEHDENLQCEAEWLNFIDEAGITHVLNFSALPYDTANMIYGDAYFSLYTRHNIKDPEMLTIPDKNTEFNSTYFLDSKPLVVVTHGWLTDDKTNWIQNIKDSILIKTDMNIITVDWGVLSKNPAYHWAALSTRYVGKKLAKLLDAITRSRNIQGKDIYLVGHSLGAHVMGYTGMFTNQSIRRITGLDPARPFFEIPLMPPNFRLEKSDADFVDIIHTSAGVLGYKSSHGHADFYPNGGTTPQPGCEGILEKIQSCSHGRAYLYFVESIGYEPGKGFVAYPCKNWEQEDECKNNSQIMGYGASDCNGDYFLRTRNESNFAIDEQV